MLLECKAVSRVLQLSERPWRYLMKQGLIRQSPYEKPSMAAAVAVPNSDKFLHTAVMRVLCRPRLLHGGFLFDPRIAIFSRMAFLWCDRQRPWPNTDPVTVRSGF